MSGILKNPIKHDDIETLLLTLLDGVVTILIPIMVLAVVYIGFRMVLAFSSAKGEEYRNWTQKLLWTFLGLLIVLGAKGILSVLKDTISGLLG